MGDPVRDLSHDHAELNRRVRAIGAMVGERATHESLATPLRELLFLHFAREEEGLFPFVSERVPDLAERVQEMATAHDAICGALARMVHLATSGAELASLPSLFERFEHAYSRHAQTEAALLHRLDGQLDAAQRARLAELVEGL